VEVAQVAQLEQARAVDRTLGDARDARGEDGETVSPEPLCVLAEAIAQIVVERTPAALGDALQALLETGELGLGRRRPARRRRRLLAVVVGA
jgi:hypothetical protein